jgi:hypothetical protein
VPCNLWAGLLWSVLAIAGPRPCDAQASAPAARLVTAAECPPGTRVVIERSTEGVVIERADPLPDSLDQTKTVRVLVLRPQTDPSPSRYAYGDVTTLGGAEVVISRGPLTLPD